MSKDRQQLVELVAAEVVRLLQGQQTGKAAPRADVRPPVGICTGDYSKFPELAGRLYGTSDLPVESAAASTVQQIPTPVMTLSGIVTANQLQQAWGASGDGTAMLAQDARLTPLANDLARQHPQRVRRVSVDAAVGTGETNARWLWWADGHCAAAQSIIARRASRFAAVASPASPGSLPQVVRDLAVAIKAGQAHGALLIVRSAARAICYANRCASLRAVVGTCGEAVEEGIAELGANILVIEYPHVGPLAMEAMVDRILTRAPAAPTLTQRDLADLHRCG